MSNISHDRAKQLIEARMRKANKNPHIQIGSRDVRFEAAPVVVQRTEEKIRQAFDFLNLITTTATDQKSEQILSMLDGQSISQRTVTDTRRPVQPAEMTDRMYNCRDVESDVIMPWKRLLSWGMLESEVYDKWRSWIIRARARDRLRVMFYGQSYNALVASNLSAYPFLQDRQKGIFQYMIENKPAHVFGITPGGVTAKGYDINPVKIGEGGDFVNMAQLTQYLIDSLMPQIYAGDNAIQAFCGRALVSDETQRILGFGTEPIQASAAEMLMKQRTLASHPINIPDEMPNRGMILCNPKVLEYIYQGNSIHKSVVDEPRFKGLVDYDWRQEDYVVNTPEACVMVHPDAILLKDANGDWVAGSTWAINPVTGP